MNLEAISQIAFSETFDVQATHVADQVISDLPYGTACAPRLAAVLSTASLVAQLESLCIRELRWHVNPASEPVHGVDVDLHQRSAVSPGETIAANGFVIGIGDREATFCVDVWAGTRQVAAGTMRFAVVERDQGPHRVSAAVPTTSARRDATDVAAALN